MLRYLKNVSGRQEDAEDLLQRLFILVYRKIHLLKEPELIQPWMYRIAKHLCYKHFKKVRKSEDFIDGSFETCDEGLFNEAVNSRIDVEKYLASLSPSMREVLVFYFLDELSLAEIADILNIPLGTVKSRIFNGLKAARASISN